MDTGRKTESNTRPGEASYMELKTEQKSDMGPAQQFYSVAEAVEYLNIHYPKVAPKSEETIRRAIRTKQLPAVMNQGREGHQILEEDLRAFGESKYGKKLKKAGMAAADALRQAIAPVAEHPAKCASDAFCRIFSMSQLQLAAEIVPGKFYELLKMHMNQELDAAHYKLKLYEEKAKWEEKRKTLLCQKQLLENELERCDSEIQAFNSEIGRL